MNRMIFRFNRTTPRTTRTSGGKLFYTKKSLKVTRSPCQFETIETLQELVDIIFGQQTDQPTNCNASLAEVTKVARRVPRSRRRVENGKDSWLLNFQNLVLLYTARGADFDSVAFFVAEEGLTKRGLIGDKPGGWG